MRIEDKEGRRILIKDNKKEVDVSDGKVIQYKEIYHKVVNDIVDIAQIPTQFVGEIKSIKYRHDEGIIGLYVEPLYIYDNIKKTWCKIVDYRQPINKYFFYPHFLKVDVDKESIDSLSTCKNVSLKDFHDITETFHLKIDSLPY